MVIQFVPMAVWVYPNSFGFSVAQLLLGDTLYVGLGAQLKWLPDGRREYIVTLLGFAMVFGNATQDNKNTN